MDCTEYPSVLCNNTAGAFSAAGAEAGRGRRGTVDEEGSEGGGVSLRFSPLSMCLSSDLMSSLHLCDLLHLAF